MHNNLLLRTHTYFHSWTLTPDPFLPNSRIKQNLFHSWLKSICVILSSTKVKIFPWKSKVRRLGKLRFLTGSSGIINGRRPVIGSYYHHAQSALCSGVCHFVATPPSRSIIHHVTMSGDEEQNVPVHRRTGQERAHSGILEEFYYYLTFPSMCQKTSLSERSTIFF